MTKADFDAIHKLLIGVQQRQIEIMAVAIYESYARASRMPGMPWMDASERERAIWRSRAAHDLKGITQP